MVFTTDHPTQYRSWLLYWFIVVIGLIGAVSAINPELGALAAVLAQAIVPLGWFVLILMDVHKLRQAVDWPSTNYALSFLAILSGLGILLYLWEREKNLPASA